MKGGGYSSRESGCVCVFAWDTLLRIAGPKVSIQSSKPSRLGLSRICVVASVMKMCWWTGSIDWRLLYSSSSWEVRNSFRLSFCSVSSFPCRSLFRVSQSANQSFNRMTPIWCTNVVWEVGWWGWRGGRGWCRWLLCRIFQ